VLGLRRSCFDGQEWRPALTRVIEFAMIGTVWTFGNRLFAPAVIVRRAKPPIPTESSTIDVGSGIAGS
jgi:hypothetical protein